MFFATIPTPDPLGYGLEPWLLQGLSYLTLTLHLLAMNFTVGSLLLLLWVRWRKPHGQDSLMAFFKGGLPLGMSYVITFGVPPLLFVQVLYGQMFYTSSVLIGFHWILVIPLVLFAYGVFYYNKLTKNPHSMRVSAWLLAGLTAALLVGFFWVNNITLSMTPDRWAEMYQRNPGGATLNWHEPTLLPRFFLIISPALVVAGLALVIRSTFLRRWNHPATAQASFALGRKAMLLGIAFEILAAGALIATLPEKIRTLVLTPGMPMVLLLAGALLIAAGFLLALTSGKGRSLLNPILAALHVALGVGALVALRDQVRLAYLSDYFSLDSVPVHTQWGVFIVFAGSLVAGLLFLVVLLVKVLPGMAQKAQA